MLRAECVATYSSRKSLAAKAQKSARFRKRLGAGPAEGLASGGLVLSVIDVGFEALPAEATKEEKGRDYFLHLPTSFSLSKTQVADLIAVGPELLEQEPAFQELIKDIGAP